MVQGSVEKTSNDSAGLFDAAQLGHAHRMPSWQRYFSRLWGPAKITAMSNTPFDASVRSRQIGHLRLNEVLYKGMKIERTLGFSELLDGSFHALNIVHKGEGTLSCSGCNTRVSAGEILFSSSPKGNVFSVPGDYVATQLMIPTNVLSSYIPNSPDVLVFKEDASSFKMTLLCGMLEKLSEAATQPEIDAATAEMIEKHILELLALSVETSECVPVSDETSVRFAHRLRIQRIIQDNVTNPDLSPNTIAGLSGLSESYLHRIFNASDQTLMQTVKRLRLEKAQDLLTANTPPRLSMGEVAYLCGFAAHSSFTRAFHQHFGVSPKAMRHQQKSLPRLM